jgi:hypothetical protein
MCLHFADVLNKCYCRLLEYNSVLACS